jgi:hypothetical protein
MFALQVANEDRGSHTFSKVLSIVNFTWETMRARTALTFENACPAGRKQELCAPT